MPHWRRRDGARPGDAGRCPSRHGRRRSAAGDASPDEARDPGRRSWGDPSIELRQGNSVVDATYTVELSPTAVPGELHFQLDASRPHDIDDVYGYFEVKRFDAHHSLVTVAAAVDVGSGLTTMLFGKRVQESSCRRRDDTGRLRRESMVFRLGRRQKRRLLIVCSHRPPCPGCRRLDETGVPASARDALRAFAREQWLDDVRVVHGPRTGFRHRARLAVRGRATSPKSGSSRRARIGLSIFRDASFITRS